MLVDSGVSDAMGVLEQGALRPSTTCCPSGVTDCADAGYRIMAYLGNPDAPLIDQVISAAGGYASASIDPAAALDLVNQLADTAPFWTISDRFDNAYPSLVDAQSG